MAAAINTNLLRIAALSPIEQFKWGKQAINGVVYYAIFFNPLPNLQGGVATETYSLFMQG